jgi:Fic family protein
MKKQTVDESDDFDDERKRADNERLMSDNERLMSELNPNEKLIVRYLIENHRIVSKDAVTLTGLSSAQVRRIFATLQEEGIVEAIGNNRGRYYQLAKSAILK